MTDRPRYRKPLPKRFNVAVTNEAYENLRKFAEETGLSNNYVLTALLEYADRVIDADAFRAAVADMLEKSRVS